MSKYKIEYTTKFKKAYKTRLAINLQEKQRYTCFGIS